MLSKKKSEEKPSLKPSILRSRQLRSGKSTNYVALLGDTPTKITFKRCPPECSSPIDILPYKQIDFKSDVKRQSSSIETPARLHSSKAATVRKPACAKTRTKITKVSSVCVRKESSQSESSCASNDIIKDDSASFVPIPKEPDSNVSIHVQPHTTTSSSIKVDTAQTIAVKNEPADDKKRTTGAAVKQVAVKKPRMVAATKTITSVSLTAVTVTSTNTQNSSIKKPCLATALLSFSHKSFNAFQQMQQHNRNLKQEVVSQQTPFFFGPTVTAAPPMPPDWLDHYEDAIMSLQNFQKFEIHPSTIEYGTVDAMLQTVPIKTTRITKTVNVDLWRRFIAARKEMLRSKTDDLNLLSELGLDERDLVRVTHLVVDQRNSATLPYSDNMALLFHCTKSETHLSNILSQGLDERLSHIFGGRLGKGIYFTDDPRKALQYDGINRILIFAVLLGDCISVDHFPFRNALVREPEKHPNEMRNQKDLFFDSIVGRPAGFNEYVIYNRSQCCPMYEIEYTCAGVTGDRQAISSAYAVNALPHFTWLPTGPNYPKQKLCVWPFLASEVFQKMGANPEESRYFIQNAETLTTDGTESSIHKKLDMLYTFGFFDTKRNQEILSKFSNDVCLTINYLLDHQPSTTTMMTTTDPIATNSITSNPSVADLFENCKIESVAVAASGLVDKCSICRNINEPIARSPELWKKLKCGHELCVSCYSRLLIVRTTMSGVTETYFKCHFCGDVTGILIGTCPNIQMNVSIIPRPCAGYESFNTIVIKYFTNAGYKLDQTAYLPDNVDGREVLRLLQIACDRRLCFTIDDSVTTAGPNVLVRMSISHKTSMRGGMHLHGYPDMGYMERVKMELKSYGIY